MRIATFALGMTLLGPKPQHRAKNNQRPAATDQRGTPTAPLVVHLYRSDSSEQAAKDETERQQKVANDHSVVVLTGWLVGVGVVQALLFFWQLALIRKSLGDTKTAADAAKISADAAKDSLTLARENALRQLRAYVSFKQFEVRPQYAVNGRDIIRWNIVPRFKNGGATPANDIAIRISFGTMEEDMPADFEFPDVDAPGTPSKASVGPGTEFDGSAVPKMDHGLVLVIAMGQDRAYIWGHVDYSDVFPETPRRTTRFAAEITVHGDPIGDEPDKLRFRMLDRHNDAT
jgi:hypothetical protein